MVFHLLNAVALYALFLSAIPVALVLMVPYDYAVSSIREKALPVETWWFERQGADARYVRNYENGDFDEFFGFYAYRERLKDRSVALASPLYYPGAAWTWTRVLELRSSSGTDEA